MRYVVDTSPSKYELPEEVIRIWREEDVPDVYRVNGMYVVDLQFGERRIMIVPTEETVYIFHRDAKEFLRWLRNVQKKKRKFLEDVREFLYHAIQTELDNVNNIVVEIHKEVSRLERFILKDLGKENEGAVISMYRLTSLLLQIKRDLTYFNLSLSKLRKLFPPDEINELRLSIKETLTLINLTLNTAGSLLDVHDKALSMELNLLIKRLTAISIILAVITIITGIYGMNFRVIPLADHPLGFWIINGFMVMLFFLMLWWFKRIGWM